jgi:octaprenyl-diphosphate synthase
LATLSERQDRAALLRAALATVEPRLRQVEAFIAQELAAGPAAVEQAGTYVFASGGKRLRPALVLLVSRLLGYQGDKDVRYAALIEMVHTATLVHDDIIDHAAVRRGRASANRRWGNQLTVLLGDWLYTRSMEIALEVDDLQVMRVLSRATIQMIEGEVLGLSLLRRLDITQEQYLEIARRKTAELFAAACSIPSLFAEQFARYRELLEEYGRNLGMCFQIVDDLLDFTSSEAQLGKPVFADLREGKLTLPLILALPRFTASQRQAVAEVATQGSFAALDPEELRMWLAELGALEAARRVAAEFGEKAAELAGKLPASPEREALAAAPWYVLDRKN